jgi:hypothetical protein
MTKTGTAVAFVAALILVCGVVALEWYSHIGRPGSGAPSPIQAVTAAPASSVPVTKATPSAPPVVYIPVQATPAAPGTPPPLNAGSTPLPEAPMATLAPTNLMPPVVREPANAPPRILAMSISTPVAHGGDIVSGTVETSSNVASVEARIGGYGTAMQKVGVGRFHLAYRVPRLPFFLHRTYTIEVIARNTHGDAVTSSVPITVR